MDIVSSVKKVDEEEAEFAYDLRLARRWKRRRIAYENLRKKCSDEQLKKTVHQNNKNHGDLVTVDLDSETFLNDREMLVGVNSGSRCVEYTDGNGGDNKVGDVLDAQYMIYLRNLTEMFVGANSDSRCVVYADGNDVGDEVSDVLDPQYMMFLNNLKEDRNSYVLELGLGNERSIVVKYEKEYGSNNGLDVENLGTIKSWQNEKNVQTGNIFRNYAEREKIESPRSDSGNENTWNARKPLTSKSNGKNNERPSIMHDAVTIEQTERQNPSPRNSRRDSNERPSIMHDEVKSENTESERTWRSNPRRENNESPGIMHDVVKIEKTESLKRSRSNLRIENNESFRIMHDAVKREKTESERTSWSNSRRENNESASIMHGVVKREKTDSQRTSRSNSRRGKNESPTITHAVVRREKTKRLRTSWSNSRREDNESPNIKRAAVKREKTESRRALQSNSRRENNESPSIMHGAVKREKTESQRTLRSNSRRKNSENPNIMHAVVKREKTKSQRTSRSNSRRENNENPSVMHAVKREKTENRRTSGSKSRKESNESPSIMYAVVMREKVESASTLRNILRERIGTQKKLEEPVLEKNVDMEVEPHFPSAENGCSKKRHSSKVTTNSAKYKCNQGGKSDLIHENYLKFMKFAQDSKHWVYEPEDSKEILCEESDSDSDVVLLDNDPFSGGNYTPFGDTDGEFCIDILTGAKESHFREGLMEFLRKPYDRMEYKKLSLEASRLRPFEDDGDFRGDLTRRRRLCGLDFNGKSYLDEYSDLASLIVQAQQDRRRILNLLRGFFYWLLNLVHEDGAFKPWLDSSCLSILPPQTWDLPSD